MSPFCTNCGRDLEEQWKVCPDCGKILEGGTAPQTQPTTQPQTQSTTQPTPQPHGVKPYQYKYAKAAGENKFGTGALVCGILGLVLGIFYGSYTALGFPILRVVAIVLGGIGISKDDLPHICDRLFRVKGAATRHITGSGLGLSLVKEVVDAHQGYIDVQSKVGEGTTFTLSFPVTEKR